MGGLASGCCAGLATSSTGSGPRRLWPLARHRPPCFGLSASPAGATRLQRPPLGSTGSRLAR
eukprot:2809170-Alexandrium_andersonii.AAC.1